VIALVQAISDYNNQVITLFQLSFQLNKETRLAKTAKNEYIISFPLRAQ